MVRHSSGSASPSSADQPWLSVPAGLNTGSASRRTERGFRESDVKHADTVVCAIDQRLMAGHVQVIDDKGTVQPVFAPIEHTVPHVGRHAYVERPIATEHAHIAEKQRGHTARSQRQGVVVVDEIIDGIDEIEVAVQQRPASSTPVCRPLASITGLAAWIIRARTSSLRSSR